MLFNIFVYSLKHFFVKDYSFNFSKRKVYKIVCLGCLCRYPHIIIRRRNFNIKIIKFKMFKRCFRSSRTLKIIEINCELKVHFQTTLIFIIYTLRKITSLKLKFKIQTAFCGIILSFTICDSVSFFV